MHGIQKLLLNNKLTSTYVLRNTSPSVMRLKV